MRTTRADAGLDLRPLTAFADEIDVDASTAGRIVRRLGMREYTDPADRRKKLFSMREYLRLSQPLPSTGEHPVVVTSPFRPLREQSDLGWFEAAGGLNSPLVRFEREVLSPLPDTIDIPDVDSNATDEIGIMWDYLPLG